MVQGTRANICQKAWGSLVTSSQNLTSISQLKESKASIIWQALPTMAGHWFKSIWKKCASLDSSLPLASPLFFRGLLFKGLFVGQLGHMILGKVESHSFTVCVSSGSTYYTLSCFFTTSPEALVGWGGPGWLFCVLNPHHQTMRSGPHKAIMEISKTLFFPHFLSSPSFCLEVHRDTLNKIKQLCPDWLLCFLSYQMWVLSGPVTAL